jgi:hypothetical protein
MSPPDAVESPGVFWLDGGPRVRGMLVREGADGHVLTEGVVREPRSVRFRSGPGWIGMDDLGDPKEIVADTVPIPLLGTLDDGRAITLIDAQLRQTEVTRRQTFHGIRLLDGAHAPDPEATFPAARLALPQPGFWRGLLDGPGTATVDLPDVSGSLRAFADDGRLWVELTLRSGLTIFEWERRFWSRCLTLLRLWTDRDLREDHAQIMTSAGDWSEFVALRSKHSESFTVHDSLLPPGSLALGTLAKALVLFDKLAPVPDIAARNLVGHVTLELAVLANASCLEGLHRRCHENSRPFPSLRGKEVGKVSRAAAEAAVAKAIELGTIGPEDRHASVTRMEEALGFHNEPTFAERLRELLPAVESATPGLIGRTGKLGSRRSSRPATSRLTALWRPRDGKATRNGRTSITSSPSPSSGSCGSACSSTWESNQASFTRGCTSTRSSPSPWPIWIDPVTRGPGRGSTSSAQAARGLRATDRQRPSVAQRAWPLPSRHAGPHSRETNSGGSVEGEVLPTPPDAHARRADLPRHPMPLLP